MSAKTRTQTLHVTCIFCCTRHKPDFGGKVRSGEVRGDRIGKAAPAGRSKSDCAHQHVGEMRRKHGCMLARRARSKKIVDQYRRAVLFLGPVLRFHLALSQEPRSSTRLPSSPTHSMSLIGT